MAKKYNVLIVEDDRFQAHLLKLLLTNLNYEVLAITDSGEEAVKLASELTPQVIIMDIALAGKIDGIEAVRRINEQSSSVNIIYVTGNSDSAHKERAANVGFVDFLIKPINKKMLVDSLSKVFLDS